MKINIKNFSEEILKIFAIFEDEKPDSIRLVGGCVRDLFLEKEINDYDFACVFLPEKTMEILRKHNVKAIPTGIKYGTITAVINSKSFEITTLRQDVENSGRHPKAEFVDDYFLDAKRRDFTINALYLDSKGEVFDYFNGFNDLKNSCVKFIGDANERIQEDFLRILRFFRFSIRYAKNLDDEAFEACVKNKKGIKILSGDRIRNEILKFFDKNPDHKKLIDILDAFEREIRPEIFSKKLNLKNLKNLLSLEEKLTQKFDEKLKFASAIIDEELDKSKLDEIFSRLNFSNDDRNYFRFLSAQNTQDLTRLLICFKQNFVRDFYLISCAKNSVDLAKINEDLSFINNFVAPDFPLDGNDLLNLGFSGKEIGEILFKAREMWIDSGFKMNKDDLVKGVIR